MLEPRFCYRILAAAGLSHDEQGNDTECFTQIELEDLPKLEQDEYDRRHEEYRHGLAEHLRLNVNYLKCISQEEYDDNVDDY
ncbi:hypothetical protein BHT95_07050 [Bacillus paralicheniformis]|uniref:hypothetical protein n=1 Tax=Bacillus TaxID=1386 RepID=UPI000951A80E|nr:hypothetical protein [Bacillus paralicheniformis]OLQ52624.1 hypothetical protein BHT95_07050 [Bacillus paralicheniformis]